ncbi:MAG: acetate--CoA ligase family protein [Phycisphaeraceae bacterium]|nr:acetate--CoA ligase family protein [Phycisphaerales bacterium]MCB9861383.1 acetate--CoA ligase family protein [Phycisphaeraceae bacterium]
MARLHEYQAKALLSRGGITVPRGNPADSPEVAAKVASDLGCPVVVKIQAWTTGRAALGGVGFADTPEEAAALAQKMLDMKVGQFPVEQVLIEEQMPPKRELFVSLTIDGKNRQPMLLISTAGGSGVEDRAGQVATVPCDVHTGPDRDTITTFLARTDLGKDVQNRITDTLAQVFDVAKTVEATSLEINPLAVMDDGSIVALDCRCTIDDYAVFRHPELGIEIARELDHPPTKLERIAYTVEQDDHRGTFFFAQMATTAKPGSKGLAGFHGAGGGGSMMSMDAITNEGFTIANFTDTSGNPSAAKVYRAARIILSQPDLCGYFGSGSGVASQEQFWSAYGLAKAFLELDITIPVVVRLGGNAEDRAVDILHAAAKSLRVPVEGYKKTDPPAKIAQRFASLVAENDATIWTPRKPRVPEFVESNHAMSFPITGGMVWIDTNAWPASKDAIMQHSSGLFKDDNGTPALTIEAEDFKSKDSECVMCEVECRNAGVDGFFVQLDVLGL